MIGPLFKGDAGDRSMSIRDAGLGAVQVDFGGYTRL